MLKRTIVYEDYEGNEVTEDFYFHLSQAELVEIELSYKGGLSKMLEEIIKDDDGATIVREFKKIILGSYGVRSDDGKRFMKSQQLREEFEATEAYSTLFIELIADASAAADFVNGIVPAKLAEKAQAVINERDNGPKLVEAGGETAEDLAQRLKGEGVVSAEAAELVVLKERIAKGEIVLGD